MLKQRAGNSTLTEHRERTVSSNEQHVTKYYKHCSLSLALSLNKWDQKVLNIFIMCTPTVLLVIKI